MISIFVLLFIKFKCCIYKFRFPEIIDENKNNKIKTLKDKLKELNNELMKTEKEIKKLERVGK